MAGTLSIETPHSNHPFGFEVSPGAAAASGGCILDGIARDVSVHAEYEVLHSVLGKGEYSQVHLGLKKGSFERVAIKVIKKADANTQQLQSEVGILKSISALRHPNLMMLQNVFESADEVHLVVELLTGGSLYSLLNATDHCCLPEPEARALVHNVASGLYQLHKLGIVHRDLKLENVMLDAAGVAKICDFGLSKHVGEPTSLEPQRRASSPCGTPGYVAPEVLDESGYDFAVDMWSLGIITFVMLCGKPPFAQTPSRKEPIATPPATPSAESPTAAEATAGLARCKPQPRASASGAHSRQRWPTPRQGQSPTCQSPLGQSPLSPLSPLSALAAAPTSPLAAGPTSPLAAAPTSPSAAGRADEEPVDGSPLAGAASRILARMRVGWSFPSPPEPGCDLSDEAKAFVTALLQEEPAYRLRSEQAVRHPWIIGDESHAARTPARRGCEAHTMRAPRASSDRNSGSPLPLRAGAASSPLMAQETGSDSPLPTRAGTNSRLVHTVPARRVGSLLPQSDSDDSDDDGRQSSPDLPTARRAKSNEAPSRPAMLRRARKSSA